MNISQKLTILADAAKYDASCASSGSKRRGTNGLGSIASSGICHSYTPDGRCISLLKILLTNYCIFDCKYCINRLSSDVKRARFTISEVVNLTLDFYKRNYIEGLFLSSGIIVDSDYTMSQLIEVAKTLRIQHQFLGYIHLKTIPGASNELVKEAGLYADRLSVNIELPTSQDLATLAPEKDAIKLKKNMEHINNTSLEIKEDKKKGMKTPLFVPAGQSTQMIIGATPTPDKDVLMTSAKLYHTYKLRRVYYSGFSPIPHADIRLPVMSPPLLREHRLYQADWLLRFYKFNVSELVSDNQPNLDIEIDPKTSWAIRNPEYFPVDINRSTYEQLLRIPGIGVKSVKQIMKIRRYHKLKLADLTKLHIAFNRAKIFLIAHDYSPPYSILNKKKLIHCLKPKFNQLTLPL
jgi:putative DNA modification/repair radical SAM protein